MWKGAAICLLTTLVIGWHFSYNRNQSKPPKLTNKYWGPGTPQLGQKDILTFTINVKKKIIDDLNEQLDRALSSQKEFVKPLDGVAWTYGMPSTHLKTILKYWRNEYNWTEREGHLNRYPQFTTKIQGFGFSDAAVKPGLAPAQIAVIFKNLMERLGFKEFYVHGGDWGSMITSDMAALFPKHIKGAHSNMCFIDSPMAYFLTILGSYIPSLVVDEEHRSWMYPLSHHFTRVLEESGYMHIQATKPDTIAALSDSPVGLAIYILEKFSTWTNSDYRFRENGGLLEKFTMEELLDNVMVYWVTNSITTSQRLCAENFSRDYMKLEIERLAITVPTA